MKKEELENLLNELKKGKHDLANISRQDSLRLILDATDDLRHNGKTLESDNNIKLVLRMIEFYDNMGRKFDTAIEEVQNELNQLKSLPS